MSVLRLLNPQGIAGLALSFALALLLVLQKGETRHWKKQSGQFEQLYGQEQSALAGTVANYRAAADQARAADAANAHRVASDQAAISERTSNEYERRLAAARSFAQRLRAQGASAATDPGHGGATPMSRLSVAPAGPNEGAGQDELSQSDRLTATEQAIQLDELIKWIRAQAAIDPNASK